MGRKILSDRQAGRKLKGPWEKQSEGVAYLTAQTRVRIVVERNSVDLDGIMQFAGDTDQLKSDKQLVEDFFGPIDPQLSPYSMSLLMGALASKLVAWSERNSTKMKFVRETLDPIMAKLDKK